MDQFALTKVFEDLVDEIAATEEGRKALQEFTRAAANLAEQALGALPVVMPAIIQLAMTPPKLPTTSEKED